MPTTLFPNNCMLFRRNHDECARRDAVKRHYPNFRSSQFPNRRAVPFRLFFKSAGSCLVLIDNHGLLPLPEVCDLSERGIFCGGAIIRVGRFRQAVIRVEEHDVDFLHRGSGFCQPLVALRDFGNGNGKETGARWQDT